MRARSRSRSRFDEKEKTLYSFFSTTPNKKFKTDSLVKKGDRLLLMPNRSPVTVAAIHRDDVEVQAARGGENLRLRLSGVDEDEVQADLYRRVQGKEEKGRERERESCFSSSERERKRRRRKRKGRKNSLFRP